MLLLSFILITASTLTSLLLLALLLLGRASDIH